MCASEWQLGIQNKPKCSNPRAHSPYRHSLFLFIHMSCTHYSCNWSSFPVNMLATKCLGCESKTMAVYFSVAALFHLIMSLWQALSSCQTAYPTSLHLMPVVTWYNKTVEGVLIEQQKKKTERPFRVCAEKRSRDIILRPYGLMFWKKQMAYFFQNKCIYLFEFLYQIYQEDNAVPVYTTLISSNRWLGACIGMTVAGITTISVSPNDYIKSKTLH